MIRKSDLTIILVWPVFATLISYYLRVNFFIGTVLYFGLPAIYLSFKKKEFIHKALALAGTALPILVVIDYIAVTTGTWFFPTSIFSYRIFGVVTFEVLFWYFSYAYFIVMFYEAFLDKHCKHVLTTRQLKNLFIFFVLILAIFLWTVWTKGSFIKIPYWYMVIGIIFAIIPISVTLFRFPKLLKKFFQATIYFAYLSFLWELVAVYHKQWTFPGNSFVGWVTIFGIRFPFEELFVWIILGAAGILSWYEFFDDDHK